MKSPLRDKLAEYRSLTVSHTVFSNIKKFQGFLTNDFALL